VTPSEQLALAFYELLGADGLAARTDPLWDHQILGRLAELLQPGQRILDAGCGYGRIAIPLALSGHRVTGLDVSDTLLTDARERAERESASVRWIHDSMCHMHLDDGSFDVVLCLWSAFHELLENEEQARAIGEFHRVLKPGGWCLIEGPLYRPATAEELAAGRRVGPEGRISLDDVAGHSNPHYVHDRNSYQELMDQAGITHFDVYESNWAGRPRLFLRFEKRGIDDADRSAS
jgi:ubiquinone/menaquinone biosynthesis C-methylase UbiE